MPVMGVVEILIQIYLGVHAGKSGRYGWIFIILFFPVIGSLIYFFVEYLPEIQMKRNIIKAKKPKKLPGINELKRQLELTDNVNNRLALARAYFQTGQFEASIELLKESLKGVYARDLHIIEGLCYSYFHNNDHANAMTFIHKYRTINNGTLPENLQNLQEKLRE
ncbi:PLDc N-terminal domain-containing protein [Desulfoluna butyratoxydans]|uniref:Cardiolipin synthase n-terminal n=1 Tax=Desulfoluna butyratoxydans TaxID=231438 RepID=A0A4V6IKW8_9BACT|nr:PLDc N-terminal domain-containing protein [Desulfoluna butyratoxydans]VFQ42798.1 cardiolipin synthase n-terminal [Desulfoluna butyratoxydans]